MIVRDVLASNGQQERWLFMWCPGCEEHHIATLPKWGWNGSLEHPTIDGSILTRGGPKNLTCHSFIRDGQWEFLSDCTHALAGQTVPMVPVPDWLV